MRQLCPSNQIYNNVGGEDRAQAQAFVDTWIWDETGRRKKRHHQFLTDDIGNPHLEKHVVSAITLMKVSATYKGFKKLLDKALPIPQSQYTLDLPHDDDEDDGDE